jgi:hypothetical protein
MIGVICDYKSVIIVVTLKSIFVSNTKSFENEIFIFWCKKQTLTSIAYDAAILDTAHIEEAQDCQGWA